MQNTIGAVKCGPIKHAILYTTALIETEYRSEFKPTKDTRLKASFGLTTVKIGEKVSTL